MALSVVTGARRDDGLSERAGVFLFLPEVVRLLASSAIATLNKFKVIDPFLVEMMHLPVSSTRYYYP